MSQVSQKIANRVLELMRSRRDASAASLTVASPVAVSVPRLRQVEFDDHLAIIALKKRWGLIPESHENWEKFWITNPALRDAHTARPMGWVLEADGQLVGYLGNISSTYFYNERKLTAVTSTGLVVEPAYRSASMTLMAAFYRQKIDINLGTTAIPAVGKMGMAFKAAPLPQADYDTVLFWVLHPYPFVGAVMKRLELQPLFARTAGILGSAVLAAERILRRRCPKHTSAAVTVSKIRVEEIGDDFQALWIQKLKEGLRLFADRTPETLRWHFSIPGDMGTTNVFCCRRNTELVGYAIIRTSINRLNGLRRTLIADMLIKKDDPDVIRSLLIAAYEYAKELGSDVFEILGFPENIRKICLEGNPYTRKYPATPFYYKATDPNLHKAFLDSQAWYATPFDGDTTLMP